ncbi:hypothetical protein PtrCC142_003649 [Pyrenophora tritici-repentis]|nr:hypothetical protein PtrSN001C_009921 [Pyrenophora tritici-repentis]KAI1574293.1 hypothetical protein PtrEW4_003274 [Pyrenophora tritici-repentis]KAI1592199.1 hypothetical protein PtrEW13061_003985 [Pyrenophora tritici-repentis]KAI1604192.1 hypothetical protein PtrCC142_003649 [Pyrenophora tritici-repentis]
MFAKALLPGDEELGKKDDDHKYKPARRSGWAIWNHAFRWRRRRTLLALAGLFVVYYYLSHGGADEYREVLDRQPRYPLGRPSTNVYQAPQTQNYDDDDDGPTGPPPGIHQPKHGESPPHVYTGDIRFYRLAASLRASSSMSEGYEKINRNVLFAMSSLRSVATLLPMACEMSQWNRNHVHVAFMGREDIPVKDLIDINGIDQEKCRVVWHDARPDYTEYVLPLLRLLVGGSSSWCFANSAGSMQDLYLSDLRIQMTNTSSAGIATTRVLSLRSLVP